MSKNGVFFFPVPEKKIQRFETSELVEFKLFPGKKNTKKKNTDPGKKKILRKIELKIEFLKPSRAKMVYPKPTELLKHILCKNHEKNILQQFI